MKKSTLRLLALLLPLLVLPALSAFADDGGRPFTTTLTGAAELPGTGDPDGFGVANLTLNYGQGEVCYDLSVLEIALPATGAHIHVKGPLGFGGVVVALSAPDATGHSSGCVSATRETIKKIMQSPENYYVNVHSTEFLAGAVRGDLSK